MNDRVPPLAQSPRSSIIILAFGDPSRALTCVERVLAVTQDESCEILVVANGVDPSSLPLPSDPKVHLIPSSINLGYSGGVNLGASHARGEYLVLLNDDAWPKTGWLSALTTLADRQPKAGAIGSRVLTPQGRLIEAGSLIWSDGYTHAIGREIAGHMPSGRRHLAVRPVAYCSGASLLIRAALFHELGGMDLTYFPAYYEDVDFSLRLLAHGEAILYAPASVVTHAESSSTLPLWREFLVERHRKVFVSRHSEWLRNAPPQPRYLLDHAIDQALWTLAGTPLRALLVSENRASATLLLGRCGQPLARRKVDVHCALHSATPQDMAEWAQKWGSHGIDLIVPAPQDWWDAATQIGGWDLIVVDENEVAKIPPATLSSLPAHPAILTLSKDGHAHWLGAHPDPNSPVSQAVAHLPLPIDPAYVEAPQ